MRNDSIRNIPKVETITGRCRKTKLRWFGHVEATPRIYLNTDTVDTRWYHRSEGSKMRWIDCVNRDMPVISSSSTPNSPFLG